PEGDYAALEHAVVVGDQTAPPRNEEILDLLAQGGSNVVVNTQHLTAEERPSYFAELLPGIAALHARSGRPHWLIIDEAHHLLPAEGETPLGLRPEKGPATVLVTVVPASVNRSVLRDVDTLVALGEDAAGVVENFCAAIDGAVPDGLEVTP